MLKGSFLETHYYAFLEKTFVPLLVKLKLRPNHLSILGLIASIISGICFAFSPFWGGMFALLSGLFDTLDGSLARSTGQTRKAGAFLDSVLDRYTELVIFLGIWTYFYRMKYHIHIVSLLIILILFGSLMVSYTRARAEGLGEKCMVGAFQRAERIILLGCTGIIYLFYPNPGVVFAILWIFFLGTNMTALWRFFHVLRNLKRQG